MKKIAFHNYYQELNKDNFMFKSKNSLIGDNLLAPLHEIEKQAQKFNIEVGTSDYFKEQKIDGYVFIDHPKRSDPIFRKAISDGTPKFLMSVESPIIRPANGLKKNHDKFDKIFTWNDDLVDNKKYFKLSIPQILPDNLSFDESVRVKFCTQIAGNKMMHVPGELYSKRLEAIKWFEKNHPEDFDLYGMGWNYHRFSGVFKCLNLLNRFPLTAVKASFPSYLGPVKRKSDVLKMYKFSICFENYTGTKGYITEKIFDAFFSGCIPIYYGADNVKDFIPDNTFIDFRDFMDFEKLYNHMKSMTEENIRVYQDNIKNYLRSERFTPFSSSRYAEIICSHLKEL